MAALALGCLFIAADGLFGMARQLASGAAVVEVATGAMAALPCAVMLLAFAAMLLLPPSAGGRRETRLFLTALTCMPLLLILPMTLRWTAGAALEDRGYRHCVALPGGAKRLGQLWARVDAACPTLRS